MIRRIVGWRRNDREDWQTTTHRMNIRLECARRQYSWKVWSMSFARAQYRFISHILQGPISLWSRILCKFNWSVTYDPQCRIWPHRFAGHPRQKWDDYIYGCCKDVWPDARDLHWLDLLIHHHRNEGMEDSYVAYVSRACA